MTFREAKSDKRYILIGRLFIATLIVSLMSLTISWAGELEPGSYTGEITFKDGSKADATSQVSSVIVSEAMIESALERSDWEKLAKLLSTPPEKDPQPCDGKPHLRFLAGHAFLATGRNNKATLCFVCAQDSVGSSTLNDWRTWTEDLIRRHSSWPSAHYLHADALARQGLMRKAVAELNRCLELNPHDYLARNARGVVHWILGTQDSASAALLKSALVDLQVAAQQPGFADAWVNLGILDLYQGYSPEHARYNFEEALARNDSFAMALNGRACAAGASGDLKQVRVNLIKAYSLCPGVPFVAANAAAVASPADTTSALGRLAHQSAAGGARGKWGTFKADFGISALGPSFSLGIETPFGPRGGLYVRLKEGENFLVDREGEPRVVGTWFVLNYLGWKPEAVDGSKALSPKTTFRGTIYLKDGKIYLKDGSVISGKITRVTSEEVTVAPINGGRITVNRAFIRKIDYREAAPTPEGED